MSLRPLTRLPFTVLLLAILCSAGVQDAASAPAQPVGTHVPGAFEIHIFDVEQADSQLIIFPSGGCEWHGAIDSSPFERSLAVGAWWFTHN